MGSDHIFPRAPNNVQDNYTFRDFVMYNIFIFYDVIRASRKSLANSSHQNQSALPTNQSIFAVLKIKEVYLLFLYENRRKPI